MYLLFNAIIQYLRALYYQNFCHLLITLRALRNWVRPIDVLCFSLVSIFWKSPADYSARTSTMYGEEDQWYHMEHLSVKRIMVGYQTTKTTP